MKLRFDENLSPRLPRLLGTLFPESMHVYNCGLEGQSDEAIWKYAAQNGYSIVSKDGDFYERSLLNGAPPKVIWICVGNCTRDQLVELLTRRVNEIRALEAATESLLLLF
jgi:predicted nuclease of predicted toxin-antitoxin system